MSITLRKPFNFASFLPNDFKYLENQPDLDSPSDLARKHKKVLSNVRRKFHNRKKFRCCVGCGQRALRPRYWRTCYSTWVRRDAYSNKNVPPGGCKVCGYTFCVACLEKHVQCCHSGKCFVCDFLPRSFACDKCTASHECKNDEKPLIAGDGQVIDCDSYNYKCSNGSTNNLNCKTRCVLCVSKCQGSCGLAFCSKCKEQHCKQESCVDCDINIGCANMYVRKHGGSLRGIFARKCVYCFRAACGRCCLPVYVGGAKYACCGCGFYLDVSCRLCNKPYFGEEYRAHITRMRDAGKVVQLTPSRACWVCIKAGLKTCPTEILELIMSFSTVSYLEETCFSCHGAK